MRLAELPTRLIEETLKKWRRRAIAGAAIALCALVAFVEGLGAARLALESVLGPVGARLVLAGVFVAILTATVLTLWREPRASQRPAEGQERASPEERVSLIAEAINLGYAVARDLRKPAAGPAADAPASESGVADRPPHSRNGARSGAADR